MPLLLPYDNDFAAILPFVLGYEADLVAILPLFLLYEADSDAVLPAFLLYGTIYAVLLLLGAFEFGLESSTETLFRQILLTCVLNLAI